MKHVLKKFLLEKYEKKSRSPRICVRPTSLDGNSGRPWNLMHSPSCRTLCRLFIHEVFFGPLGLHLCVWSEFGRSPPSRPMRAIRMQWSWAFSLVCEVALTSCRTCLVPNEDIHVKNKDICCNNHSGVLRATSHTGLEACEQRILRSLIGRNGWDCPSSLHTRRWRPKDPKKESTRNEITLVFICDMFPF